MNGDYLVTVTDEDGTTMTLRAGVSFGFLTALRDGAGGDRTGSRHLLLATQAALRPMLRGCSVSLDRFPVPVVREVMTVDPGAFAELDATRMGPVSTRGT